MLEKFNNLLNYEYAILKYIVCVLIYDDHKLNKLIFQGRNMNFVKRIDDYISEKNLSYGDLGIQVDVTQPTISKWINGESEISITTLCKIIQKFLLIIGMSKKS